MIRLLFKKLFCLIFLLLASTSAMAGDDQAYTVEAGDVLHIAVWKEEDLDREVLVLPDGSLDFPLIGSLQASGKTVAEIKQLVKEKLSSLIPDASVSVAVKAALGHQVSVLGQVAKPGAYQMGHRLSVMEALSQAGGLTAYASESNIRVIRTINGKKKSIAFPYDDISRGQNLEQDITLRPGDIVLVPTSSLF